MFTFTAFVIAIVNTLLSFIIILLISKLDSQHCMMDGIVKLIESRIKHKQNQGINTMGTEFWRIYLLIPYTSTDISDIIKPRNVMIASSELWCTLLTEKTTD